ncbi:metabotropic glutamate receptor 1-like [Ptychodera flava]|uniref:metabotropic glutamate receptor 1-like n=1 Tax=Ptychodera flava TaxID=63121 RepID=UPI00396A74FC
MCFAALFVKAVRVYRIGKHERRISGPKPKFISALSQTIFYSGVMLSELLLVVEWLLVDPPGVVFQDGAFVCRQGIEAFITSLLYVYLLIVVTTVIAFLARNSSDVFHESLYILITCVGSILTIITWAIVAVKGPEGYERPAICFGILLNTTLIFILMFIPKIRLILTKHEFFDNASITSNITISDGRSGAFQNPTYNVYGDAVKVDAEDDSKERQSTEDSSAADQDDINPQLVSQNTTSF